MANLHPAIAGPAASDQDEPAPVVRDLLDDIATVLGADRWDAEKVPAADIPARLRTLAPDWAPYRSINGLEIRRYLETEHGVKVATTGHKYPVDPAAIRDAIARRDADSRGRRRAGRCVMTTIRSCCPVGKSSPPGGASEVASTVARTRFWAWSAVRARRFTSLPSSFPQVREADRVRHRTDEELHSSGPTSLGDALPGAAATEEPVG